MKYIKKQVEDKAELAGEKQEEAQGVEQKGEENE